VEDFKWKHILQYCLSKGRSFGCTVSYKTSQRSMTVSICVPKAVTTHIRPIIQFLLQQNLHYAQAHQEGEVGR